MAEFVVRKNSNSKTGVTYAVEFGQIILGTEQHQAKHRNSTVLKRFVLTAEQEKLSLDELAKLMLDGGLTPFEPKRVEVNPNEAALTKAAKKQVEKT